MLRVFLGLKGRGFRRGKMDKVDPKLVLEIVSKRGFFRKPSVESFHDVLVRKLKLNQAAKSIRGRKSKKSA